MQLINSILSELLIHNSKITLCFRDETKRDCRLVKVESDGKTLNNKVTITSTEMLGVLRVNSLNIESISCYPNNEAIILLQQYYNK